jgi:hypothetical protein
MITYRTTVRLAPVYSDRMPLTLRPTGLSRDPNTQDWNTFDGGAQPA